MKVKLCLKNSWFLLAILILGLQACGDDETTGGGGSTILNRITLSDQTYSASEDGTFSVSFQVEPAKAEIGTASATPEILSDGLSFECTSITKGSDGNWTALFKTADVARLKAEQSINLYVSQPEGGKATASFTLKDPYAMGDLYEANSPFSVSFCDVNTKTVMGLPVILTAKEGGDLSKITGFKVDVENTNSSTILTGSDFGYRKLTDACGIEILLKQETADQIMEDASPIIATFKVYALNAQGRATSFIVKSYMAAPYVYISAEEMSFKRSDLQNKDFEKNFQLEVTDKMQRLGLFNGVGQPFKEDVNFWETGLFTLDGTLVEEDPLFIVINHGSYTEINTADVIIHGYENITESGDYYYAQEAKLDWTFGDFTCPRIRGEVRYKLSITD